jgi:hypothetical protein
MNRTLLVAALFAVALSACSKKEETATALPAPAVAPSLPAATPAEAPAAPAAATDAAKPADAAAPAAPAEQKPAN